MKNIPGFPGYKISRSGRVFSNRSGRFITPHLSGARTGSYYRVGIIDHSGKQRMMMLHRLLAEAFLPNKKKLPFINHIDGDKLNNSLKNLEWCDNSHNQRHAYAMGLQVAKSGNEKATHKLFEKDIAFIRSACKNRSISQSNLAKMFGVHRSTILNVHLGKSWRKF